MIWLPYLIAVACVVFSAWYGIRNWNKEDKRDEKEEEVNV